MELERPEPGITRREFVSTVASAAVLTSVAATTLVACKADEDEDDEEFVPISAGEDPDPLQVSAEQLVAAVEFDEQPLADYLTETSRFTLPFGTIVYQVNNESALTLTPRDGGKALIDVNLLNLNSGRSIVLLNEACGAGYGHPDAIIYDARASDALLAWTECDTATLQWQFFIASLGSDQEGNLVVGQPTLVDEGDPEYEVPSFAVFGLKAYWSVMPNPDGSARYEDSYLKTIVYGDVEAEIVYVSHGRMSTSPLINQGLLTFTPRVDTNNIYYQLTAMNIANNRLVTGAVMPQSVRLLDAIYLDASICFSIENNYSHAGGLGFYGTYWQLDEDRWLHLFRKPSGPPVLLNGWLAVKSSTRVIVIDTKGEKYCSIAPLADSVDYGDTLAGWGLHERLAIYTNVRSTNSLSTAHGVLRVFSPVIRQAEEPQE
ncbi:MAG: hypothetical protein FWD45_04750 [Coriobacteriia bacterium]|nr:hypothetical protein [Coriobacteriia bacterium]